MPGSPAHLVSRFVDYLTATRLRQSECDAVRNWLTPELADLFFEQNVADQRHAYHAALTVVAAGVIDRDVLAAALLHDVGKRHARLGPVGRSVATILIVLALPISDRMATYRDHGFIGAQELAAAGAPALAIEYTLNHQRRRPVDFDPATWDLLMAADEPPKTRAMLGRRITSIGT